MSSYHFLDCALLVIFIEHSYLILKQHTVGNEGCDQSAVSAVGFFCPCCITYIKVNIIIRLFC